MIASYCTGWVTLIPLTILWKIISWKLLVKWSVANLGGKQNICCYMTWKKNEYISLPPSFFHTGCPSQQSTSREKQQQYIPAGSSGIKFKALPKCLLYSSTRGKGGGRKSMNDCLWSHSFFLFLFTMQCAVKCNVSRAFLLAGRLIYLHLKIKSKCHWKLWTESSRWKREKRWKCLFFWLCKWCRRWKKRNLLHLITICMGTVIVLQSNARTFHWEKKIIIKVLISHISRMFVCLDLDRYIVRELMLLFCRHFSGV